jgi:membrane associated rhomboid family serine protease
MSHTHKPLRSSTRAREPMFNMPGVVLALVAVCTAIHLLRVYAMGPSASLLIILNFGFMPLRFTSVYPLDLYAILSPITYSFLHGSIPHLLINMIWLMAFGSPLANRIGALRFLALWVVTAVAAVLLHFVLHPYDAAPLVGASGAISGMMGAAARFTFRSARIGGKPYFIGPVLPLWKVFRSRMTVTFLVIWFLINFAVGLGFGMTPGGPRVAWEAHIGGFLAGFFLIRFFERKMPSDKL